MNLVLFDDPACRAGLLPFTFTRPVSEMRVGILTIREKWEKRLGAKASWHTEPYLATKFPSTPTADDLLVNGAVCPDDSLVDAVRGLGKNESLVSGDSLLAARVGTASAENLQKAKANAYNGPVTVIRHSWDIFTRNAEQIRSDFKLVTAGRTSREPGDKHTIVYGAENIFIEENVSIRAAILNAENGPIYLGKNSTVQEGGLIKGAFALCEDSLLNVGCKMRGDSTVGPMCKVGGEVSNSVLFGYSSKLHDGFLGNSVIGEWCNLGADTNTSNMKNNYDLVKIWNFATGHFTDTGLQFCGLMMGDHGKCGINTMFNTGTVVGVSANIFGSGYPRQYIPSFSWGGAGGFHVFQLERALETAERAMARRNIKLTEADRQIFAEVFRQTFEQRKKTVD